MATKELPSADILRQLLQYDPSTGSLFWRERPSKFFEEGARTAQHKANNWNARWAEKPALAATNCNGSKFGPIFGRYVLAHRVIWAMQTGEWPDDQIDHINGVRTDNRWANLRAADHQINGRNAKRSRNNTSGHTGVYWYGSRKKWAAQITVDRQTIRLGYFDEIEAAIEARKLAESEHDFSATHGRE